MFNRMKQGNIKVREGLTIYNLAADLAYVYLKLHLVENADNMCKFALEHSEELGGVSRLLYTKMTQSQVMYAQGKLNDAYALAMDILPSLEELQMEPERSITKHLLEKVSSLNSLSTKSGESQ